MDNANQDFAENVHAYLGEFIRAADQKAAFLLAAATALFAQLATQRTDAATQYAVHPCRSILLIVAIALVGLSALLSMLAVLPRQHRIRGGLISWAGILEVGGPTQYSDKVSKLGAENCLNEVTTHCYRLAEILKTKYRLLWLAICVFIFAGVASVVLIALR